jgi:beta-glucosidase
VDEGNDPYLAGALLYETVEAMQQNVIACTKHFIAYEQETNRLAPGSNALYPDQPNASVSSNLDDRSMHELYLWPFADAVRAGTGAVMCSLQRVNNSYACQNSKALNGLLKSELAFQGFVVSDYGAAVSGIPSALAGMDMAQPSSEYFAGRLVEAVENGSLPQSR